jgi:hypothetical protein
MRCGTDFKVIVRPKSSFGNARAVRWSLEAPAPLGTSEFNDSVVSFCDGVEFCGG